MLISELRTPAFLMLDHTAPQIYLAVNTIFRVAESSQVAKTFAGIDAARATGFGNSVATLRPAHRNQRLVGLPLNPVQRFQPGIPPPHSVSDDGRDVVGRCHGSMG